MDRECSLTDQRPERNWSWRWAPHPIRGVRPEEKVGVLDLQRNSPQKVVSVEPPEEVRFDSRSPGNQQRLFREVPTMTELQLEGAHLKTTPWNEKAGKGEMTQKASPSNDALLPVRQKFGEL